MKLSPNPGIPLSNTVFLLASAAPVLGMSLDVKDRSVLGQEEVGMALHGYRCCLSPFPTAHGRKEWKKSLQRSL